MIRLIIILCIFSIPSFADAQNFIGLSEKKIKKIMTADYKAFSEGEKTVNEQYHFIRYSTDDETETWIIFFDDEGLCKGVRVTCDTSLTEIKRKELNEKYSPSGPDNWTCIENGHEVMIDIKIDKWFLTITYRKVNKKA